VKNYIKISIFLFLILALSTVTATADSISLSDTTLQEWFNGNGFGYIDAADDQMSMPQGWTLTSGSTASNMTLYLEDPSENIAFGVYSLTGGELAEVFNPADTPKAAALVSFLGDVMVMQWLDSGGSIIPEVQSYDFTGQSFGFYIATGGYGNSGDGYTKILYSDSDKNGGEAALLAFNADSGSYFFAGDIDGDSDFSDIITHAESIKPTPEPTTMLLLGIGLAGFGAFGRKKLRNKT
jgi:hypothetical protein